MSAGLCRANNAKGSTACIAAAWDVTSSSFRASKQLAVLRMLGGSRTEALVPSFWRGGLTVAATWPVHTGSSRPFHLPSQDGPEKR